MTMTRIRAAVAVALLCTVSAFAQTVSSVSFQITIPAGAVDARVWVKDEDSIVDPDDPLSSNLNIGTFSGETFDTGDLAKVLIPGTTKPVVRNEGGEVAGGNGSSGESEAEVYVVVQFYDANGDKIGAPVTTSTKSCSIL